MNAATNPRPGRPPSIPTPGARVVVRDAEWIVRRVDHAPGGHQIVCDGVSELVRGREAVFLTALEPAIEVLDPAETRLVPDDSARFSDSILYIESQLRQAVPSDEEIHIGHGAAMDLVPYQLDPARLALARPRQRILIADAVGLGKTLEAGILVSELIARGRGRRILVLALKSMLTQLQKELWNRFTIPLTRLDSIGIQRVRSRIPANHNPFYYYDKSIISIDTLKQDAEYRTYLEQARWDIIVIDEAHNVADRGTRSLRNHLAKLLARRSDTLIMLSATPHDGKARSFASLVNMLDATAIADPDDYSKEDFRPGLVIRRFKKDVQEQVREAFKDRKVFAQRFPASPEEEAAYEALLAVRVAGGQSDDAKKRDLFIVTLEKALVSSPAACIETVTGRIERREREIAHGEDPSPRGAEIAAFGRSEAPILSGVPGLLPGEAVFVFSGLVPNQKSHPLVYEWIAVSFRGEETPELLPFEALLERTGLGHRAIANLQRPPDVAALSALLPAAVERAREHFIARRDAFETIINAKLEDEVRALDDFRDRRLRQLELALSTSHQAEPFKHRRDEQERHDVKTIHDEYVTWIEETMTTEPHPWIRAICAMTALAQPHL